MHKGLDANTLLTCKLDTQVSTIVKLLPIELTSTMFIKNNQEGQDNMPRLSAIFNLYQSNKIHPDSVNL